MTTGKWYAPAASQVDAGADLMPRLALLPWGDLIEDFLDEIGVSLEAFSSSMTGGWLFGYVDALRSAGISTSIFCFSARVDATTRSVHEPTGAEIVFVRAPAPYLSLRRYMKDPYGGSAAQMFGATTGPARQLGRVARHVAPYLATPVLRLCGEIRQSKCGAVLCQEYEAPRFDAAVVVGRLLGIPVFATFQGGNWQRSAIERRLRPFTLRQCAGVIVGSSTEAARIADHYRLPSKKICRTFNSLDLSMWRPRSRQDARRVLEIPETTRVAIWHGRIDIRRKGLDVLLEAWRTVCSERWEEDILLLLVGSGVEDEALDEEIQRTGMTRVRRIRTYVLNQAVVAQYLNAADVYVFPSRHEGFPVAPLEAMACGLPIVAASVSGIAEIIDDGELSGGVIFPVGDAVSLAEQLRRFLRDRTLSCILGARARARVEQAFSAVIVGSQLRTFFRRQGGFPPS